MPTRPPLVLASASFISSFDRFAVTPMLVLIALSMEVPIASAVAVASGYFLAYGLSQPLWGILSDRFGRIPIMRVTLLAAAATGLISTFAPSLAVLITARVLAGAFMGAVVPTTLTYVGDTVSRAERQGALSDLMAAQAVGTAMATAVSGVLAHWLDWRVVFAVPAVCAALCALLLGRLPEPNRAAVTGGVGSHIGGVLRNRWALLVFALVFVEGAVLLGTLTFLPSALVNEGLDVAVAGLATGAYGVGVLVFSRVVKAINSKLPVPRLIAIGGTQVLVGYALVALDTNLTTVIITALLLGGGWSFMHTSLQAWATEVAPEARGTAVALFACALFLGSATSSAAAGPLADHGHYTILFAAAAAVALPLVTTATYARTHYHRKQRTRA